MQLPGIPVDTTDWAGIEPARHAGEHGCACWRMREFGGVRVRRVEYTPGCVSDHGCGKGHVPSCLDGELHTEPEDGRRFILIPA